jgi:hypothetical protein
VSFYQLAITCYFVSVVCHPKERTEVWERLRNVHHHLNIIAVEKGDKELALLVCNYLADYLS